jgi:hypothetical protein
MSNFVKNAMNAADIIQSYEDLIADNTEDLSADKVQEIVKELNKYEPRNCCEAGAKAMILFVLNQTEEGKK